MSGHVVYPDPQHPFMQESYVLTVRRARERFALLERQEFEWRSFLAGWIEGRGTLLLEQRASAEISPRRQLEIEICDMLDEVEPYD